MTASDGGTGADAAGAPPTAALAEVWDGLAGEPAAVDAVTVAGAEPLLRSVFRLATAATAAVGVATLAAAALWHDRGGPPVDVVVDPRHAVAAFRSEQLLSVDGRAVGDPFAALSAILPTADGWVRTHANHPRHGAAVRRVLRLAGDDGVDAARAAARAWHAVELEEAVLAAGGAAAASRTRARWQAGEPGRAVAVLPLVELAPIRPTAPLPLGPGDRPLAGVRVLDLTHVVAGPVCGRVLAAHGADVLHVGAPHLPTLPALWPDTAAGKRSCHLDLRTDGGRAGLAALVREADVVVRSFRPGALDGLGLAPRDLVALRPGIVVATVSAYGRDGPWSGRRGFDSLVQLATGMAHEQMVAARTEMPVPLPCQALDHATGWLAAAGVAAALRRRHRAGGSTHVQVSLARTARWVDGLGRVHGGLAAPPPALADAADLLEEVAAPVGRVTRVRPPGLVAGAPPRWDRPPPVPGSDLPAW